jgi:hypothetical protein
VRLVAAAAVLQLVAGTAALALMDRPERAGLDAGARARAAPAEQLPGSAAAERAAALDRDAEVTRLLASRAAAVLGRDREAFLATVDAASGRFFERQQALFDALSEVPLASWRYGFDPLAGRAADAALDARYGRGQWWGAQVRLTHSLAEFDEAPSTDEHHLTFVRRDGRWLLAADDDFAAIGGVTERALWDGGPVDVVRTGEVLVLGHGDPELLREIAATTAAAVPAVSAVWTDPWSRRVVVLVPSTTKEMSSLLSRRQDLARIAAVATTEPSAGTAAVVDRVLVNPESFGPLGAIGRRVVLTHEVTHVATRRATGPSTPAWFAEGLADYVAYDKAGVPVSLAAADLREDVRAGRLPSQLPPESAFEGGNPQLAQAYQQSWLAVRLLAERFGEPAVMSAYRALGTRTPSGPPAAVVSAELERAFGLDTDEFTAAWRADLQRQLG